MSTTTRRSIALVFIAAVMAFPLLGASCTVNQGYTGGGGGPGGSDPSPAIAQPKAKLLFLGDSLFVVASNTLDSTFEGTYEVANQSVGGTTNAAMLPAAATTAATHPDIVVIDLAGNDANASPCVSGVWVACPPGPSGFDAASVEADMQTINADYTAVGACVVWVTGSTDHDPGWHPENEQILDQFEKSTFPHIVDWGAAYQPSYYDQPDNPHPNATGQQALADVIGQAITGCR